MTRPTVKDMQRAADQERAARASYLDWLDRYDAYHAVIETDPTRDPPGWALRKLREDD